MTLLEHLKAVRELIGTPEKWTKQVYARDHYGMQCSIQSEEACTYCIVGAIRKICDYRASNTYNFLKTYSPMKSPQGEGELICFNDNPCTEHSSMMTILDKAINDAELEEFAKQLSNTYLDPNTPIVFGGGFNYGDLPDAPKKLDTQDLKGN